jgi:hypothetical protein
MTLPPGNAELMYECWMQEEWSFEDSNDPIPGESGETDFNGARLSEVVDAADTQVGDCAIKAIMPHISDWGD